MVKINLKQSYSRLLMGIAGWFLPGLLMLLSLFLSSCQEKNYAKVSKEPMVAGLLLSGYQQGQELPAVDMANLPPGFIAMSGDLTAAYGPWGTSFAANITSHETGIGNWSLEQFKTAMQKGKYKGIENARDLLPPMPWFNFAHLTDEDLEAMYHYLQSTEPVDNVVPAPVPPGAVVAMN